jgi:hypothetical protein
LACLYIVAGFFPFFPFFLFFLFFLCSACRGCFCPVLACRGSWSVSGAFTFLYVPFGGLWQALALLACRGFVAGVFTLSRVAVCRCCRFCRFVCVCLYRWQVFTLSRGVCFKLSRCACIPVRLSGVRTSVRLGSFEQVFETSVLMAFLVSLAEFPTESEPNFDFVAFCP